MNEKYIHILGITLTVLGFGFIAFLYWAEPRSIAEVATRSQVVLGTYAVNTAEFDRGLASFREEKYVAARSSFDLADPEKRDAKTQFYIAYSYYRQGWGRIANDDSLFQPGLEAVNRVIAIDPAFRSTDENLLMHSPAELKNELEEGLKFTGADLNPLKILRERK